MAGAAIQCLYGANQLNRPVTCKIDVSHHSNVYVSATSEPQKADDADSVTMPPEEDLHNTPPGDGADEELPLDDDNTASARAPQPMPTPTRTDAAPQGKQPFTFMNICGWSRQLLWDAQIESCFPIYLTRKQLFVCRVFSFYIIKILCLPLCSSLPVIFRRKRSGARHAGNNTNRRGRIPSFARLSHDTDGAISRRL